MVLNHDELVLEQPAYGVVGGFGFPCLGPSQRRWGPCLAVPQPLGRYTSASCSAPTKVQEVAKVKYSGMNPA